MGWLTKLRVLIASLMLLAVTSVFLRYDSFGETVIAFSALNIQFIPSILRLNPALFGLLIGFPALILLTLLFGRVYCSFICPLGIFQDILIFLGQKLSKKNFKFQNSNSLIHFSVLVFSGFATIFGTSAILGIIEPFSFFGRITSAILRPISIFAFKFTDAILPGEGVSWFNAVGYNPVNLLNTFFAVMSLLFLIVATRAKQRFFCNTICPTGAILRLLSRFSWFKLKINEQSCTHCGLCSNLCKAGCIEVGKGLIDNSRCVSCMNCLAVCRFGAIKITSPKDRKGQVELKQTANELDDTSRRRFIIGATASFAGIALPTIASGKVKLAQKQILPPGAITNERFQSICTSCHLCVSACPSKIIRPSFLENGLNSFLQPKVDFEHGMCEQTCRICAQTCPTGAIKLFPKEVKELLKIGEVNYKKHLCVVETDGTDCGACAEHCPTKAVRMVPYKNGLMIPETTPEICIGCGGCEHICPVRPEKAIVVNPISRQIKIEMPEEKTLQEKGPIEEFPF